MTFRDKARREEHNPNPKRDGSAMVTKARILGILIPNQRSKSDPAFLKKGPFSYPNRRR